MLLQKLLQYGGLPEAEMSLTALMLGAQHLMGKGVQHQPLHALGATPLMIIFGGAWCGAWVLSHQLILCRLAYGRGFRVPQSQQHHVPMRSAPLSTDPLSKTPWASSRAPDFPESRSRLTLAERAVAAMRDH